MTKHEHQRFAVGDNLQCSLGEACFVLTLFNMFPLVRNDPLQSADGMVCAVFHLVFADRAARSLQTHRRIRFKPDTSSLLEQSGKNVELGGHDPWSRGGRKEGNLQTLEVEAATGLVTRTFVPSHFRDRVKQMVQSCLL